MSAPGAPRGVAFDQPCYGLEATGARSDVRQRHLDPVRIVAAVGEHLSIANRRHAPSRFSVQHLA